MNLVWVKYTTRKKELKVALFLYLGKKNTKYHLIRSDSLSPNEQETVKKALGKLSTMSLDQRVAWIKNNAPVGYQKSYRVFDNSKAWILKSYPIK